MLSYTSSINLLWFCNLITKIKKYSQFLFRNFFYIIFRLFYGKVNLPEKTDEKILDKSKIITMEENRKYKIFQFEESSLYTDRIYNAAIIKKNLFIEEGSFQIDFDNKRFSKRKNIVLEIGTPRIRKKIKGNILSLLTGGGGNKNYFHWMFDVLPRIGLYTKAFNLKDLNFLLVPDNSKNFQRETLKLLNFDQKKILSSVSYRHIFSENLFVTQHPYCLDNFDKDELNMPIWISKWLKKSFLNKINEAKKFPSKIYIDRRDSDYHEQRTIVNEDEIINFLKKKDFTPIQLSKYSFIDQVKLFRDANHVVGLHGAGFSNIVFCKDNTNILEFRTKDTGKLYENIGIQNNLNFKNIESKSLNPKDTVQQGSIYVDVKDIENLLD